MIKSKWFRRWLAMSLSTLLVLTMAPGVFAAQSEGAVQKTPILERMNTNIPQLKMAKIDEELSSLFKQDKYVTYLVKMVEQVDTEKVAEQAQALSGNKATPAAISLAKAEAVVSALRETSLRTQLSLSKFLEEMQQKGEVQEFKSYYIVNGMSITSTKEVMEKVASFAEVEKILPNRTHTLDVVEKTATTLAQENALNNIEWNINQVNAPGAWALGYDGTGIVVASMDSGVDINHPALQRKWRGNDVEDWRMSWFDPFTSSTSPTDGHGHGTHTMGTMVGSEDDGSNQVGVAPGATWISARIFDSAGSTDDRKILDGGQWILAPLDAAGVPHPEYRPAVVNNSWGSTAAGMDEWFRPMVQAWRSAGIFPEFSAGNTTILNPGGPGSIASPGNYPESFATAATDINKNLAGFSLRGPTPKYNEMKPDISAPGVNVRSSVPGGRYEGGWNGTSMAGPHVTATAALMLQANASLDIDSIERIMRETATPLTDSTYPQSPNYGYGWGLVDAHAAVLAVADGLGTINGSVSIAGDDTEPPVIQHNPVTDAYSGFDIPLSLQVSDNVSITSVDGFARKVGDDDWTFLQMQRTSGDYKAAEYSTVIPAFLLDSVGVEYYFSVSDYGNNRVDSQTYVIEISNGITPGYFQDFENDAIGFESGGQNNTWQWGVPTSGPGKAYSGEKLIATNLTGDYSSSSNSYMQMPPIDLTALGEDDIAYLTFMHWYNTENNYDKVSVQIASDNSDGEFVKVREYTAESQVWLKEFIDLTPYLGQQIHLRFYLNSDGSVTRPGWYIDDIALLGADEEPPAAPANLTADVNSIGDVVLNWDRVTDPDLKDYYIYRSTESGSGYEEVGRSNTNSFIDSVESGTYYYTVKARDYSNNLSEFSNEAAINVVAPNVIFSDNFDGEDNNGWTHSGAGDIWERGVPTSGPMSAYSEPNVWATNLSGSYNSNSNNQLVSPVIDLKDVDNATLNYYQWYKIETNWDKGFVEITKDGGTTWTELAMFTHTTNGMQWAPVILNLTPHVGYDVQIRFRLTSDGSVNYDGWYIDNFRVLSMAPVDEDVTKGAVAVDLSSKAKSAEPAADKLQRTMDKSLFSTVSTGKIQPAALPMSATVTVLESGRSTKTDPATGNFSMVHSAGDFTLVAEAYGYYPNTQSVSVGVDEVATVNFQLEPLPTGTLSGTVTDERSGEAIAGAILMLSDPRIAPVTTDASGAFNLTALAGNYTISVIANDYIAATVPVTISGNDTTNVNIQLKPFIGYSGEIKYDSHVSGEPDDAVVLNVSGGFGVRMTPAYPTAQVEGALFKFFNTSWPVPGGTAIQYAIYDASGPGGTPGNMISGPFNGTAKRDNTWTEVSFENPVTVQGDFYLVYLQVGLNPNAPGIGLDETGPNAHRSMMLASGGWEPLPEDYGNLLIRAKVKYPVGAPVIISPENGSFTNVEDVTVTITSQAEGSTMNLYNGNDVAGTGTVTNGQVAIDITLHDGENQLSAVAMVNGKLSDRSAVVRVTLDQVAPELEVTAPVDGFKTNLEYVHVVGTVSDDHLEGVYVNGHRTTVNNDGSFDQKVLLEIGENEITVRAVDLAGNETVVTRTVHVEQGAITLTNIQPAQDIHAKPGDTINVSFDSVEGLDASFRVEIDLSTNGVSGKNDIKMNETSPGHYEGAWTIPANLNVPVLIHIFAEDEFGNKVDKYAPGKVVFTEPEPEPEQPKDETDIIVHPSKEKAAINEAFSVDIDFTQTSDLYAAQFSLTYDAGLTKGTVSAGAELTAHQVAHNAGQGLIVSEKVVDLGNGKLRSDYLLSLAGDFTGYSGTGSLATFNFSSAVAGNFDFEIFDVRLLNSDGHDIVLDQLISASVVVETGQSGYNITGNIVAEAFGESVDYSMTWYAGADAVHKVVVEALNEDGSVAGVGAVNADGSYSLTVNALGNYTIRVVVPGHFGAEQAVTVDGDQTVDFGPLTAGDVNGDGVIDLVDLQLVAKQFGKKANEDGTWSDSKASAANITRSGEVDMTDISFVLSNFGRRK